MERPFNSLMQADSVSSAHLLDFDLQKTDLEVVKTELHKLSESAGYIDVVGPLAAVDARDNWTGDLSLDNRLESGELTKSEIEIALSALAQCYMQTSKGAASGCVDGRRRARYDDNKATDFAEKLGPKTAGGTIGDALDRRVAISEADGADQISDIEEVIAINDDYLPGDHVAENRTVDRTGCAAADSIENGPVHISTIKSKRLPEVKSITQMALGDKFSDEVFDGVVESCNEVVSNTKYFKDKTKAMDTVVEHSQGGAPVLGGVHNEVFVSLNLVRGTTLHRDHFSSMFDDKIQAFNFDLWRTEDRAKTLFPDNVERQSKYIHMQVARTVDLLMTITDGSLLFVVRRPHA